MTATLLEPAPTTTVGALDCQGISRSRSTGAIARCGNLASHRAVITSECGRYEVFQVCGRHLADAQAGTGICVTHQDPVTLVIDEMVEGAQ